MSDHFKYFLRLWDKLYEKHKNTNAINVDQLIEDWLKEFRFDHQKQQQIFNYTKSFRENSEIQKFALSFYKSLLLATHKKFFGFLPVNLPNPRNLIPTLEKKVEELKEDSFKNIITDVNKEIMNSQTKLLLLIAFALASIGIAIYLLNQKQNSATGRGNTDREDSYSSLPKTSKIIVFFALDADRAEETKILADLENKRISQNVIHFMSQTTDIKTLWQGKEEDYNSKLKECWDCPSIKEKDQYDIYLVKIELESTEPEFQEGSPAASWRRAFKRISDNHNIKIEVSKRKPKEAVNNPHLKIPR